MFDVDLSDAELLFCDTELHESQYQAFLKVLSSVQDHTRLASYKNLHEITAKLKVETSWEQLEINKVILFIIVLFVCFYFLNLPFFIAFYYLVNR